MRFRLFQYALPADEDLADLNVFLASERVAAVSHHLAPHNGGSMLVFVVETAGVRGAAKGPGLAPKVDYREVLSEEEFAIYGKLRHERKRIADAEGIPVYAVFSNAQLADMVRNRRRTSSSLAEIDGIGKARLEKYAGHFLPILEISFEKGAES